MMATKVVASRPPKRRQTGMPTACAVYLVIFRENSIQIIVFSFTSFGNWRYKICLRSSSESKFSTIFAYSKQSWQSGKFQLARWHHILALILCFVCAVACSDPFLVFPLFIVEFLCGFTTYIEACSVCAVHWPPFFLSIFSCISECGTPSWACFLILKKVFGILILCWIYRHLVRLEFVKIQAKCTIQLNLKLWITWC